MVFPYSPFANRIPSSITTPIVSLFCGNFHHLLCDIFRVANWGSSAWTTVGAAFATPSARPIKVVWARAVLWKELLSP